MVGNVLLRYIYSRYCNRLLCISRSNYRMNMTQWASSKAEQDIEVTNKPVPYLPSEAGQWKARYTNSGDKAMQDRPRIESTAIAFSLAAILIYFCIFREENDLDDWLREMENTVPIQVQEYQLRTEITEGVKRGQDMRHLKVKLAELLEKKKQDSASRTLGK